MSEIIWEKSLSLLELDSRIKGVVFDSVLKKMKYVKEIDDVIVLSCRDEFSMNIVKDKSITSCIEDAIHAVSDKYYKVRFVIEGDDKAINTVSIAEKKISERTVDRRVSVDTNLNPELTFENFIVGNCNRYAQAASVRVADKPGQTQYNPLFLFGNSGLGKTHLMHAIGNRIINNDPSIKVIYKTCENFTNEYINCISKKNFEPFRNLYRNVDVLMIDDIQFLIGKEGIQEEFFNTFESLITSGKQIVITSDKAPNNLTSLDERLTSRFKNGYTMDVQPPDFETRMAILSAKFEQINIKISEEAKIYICENITKNIRDLNGAYNILSSFYAMSNEEITLEFAEDKLKNIISPKKSQQISPELIISLVSKYYGVSVEKIQSKNRSKEIITPRYVAIYLCREMLDNFSLKTIGKFFGGRDHSTLINAINKVDDDPELLADVAKIKKSME
ncbi:MAG: chromosomal replication initiator protein DnaA [Clostridiales bacterium]|nr:chromosomal replication initiator protein DnaA [Clostridiales bacterium]